MSPYHLTLLLFFALFNPISSTTHSHFCSEDFRVMMPRERNITHCKKLTTLGAEFGWNYHNDSSIDIFFGAKLNSEEGGWLAWGVNPSEKPQMVGTRALIGIKQPNGSLVIKAYNITSDTKMGCKLLPSEIDLGVSNLKIDYSGQSQYCTIFATIVLPKEYNISRLNHVWQVGYRVLGTEPKMHPTTLQNVDSSETIDLNRESGTQIVGKHQHHLRMVHGILNIIGWGTLLPIGVIIARYMRKFPLKYNWWFVLHVSLQTVGYIIGTTGWAIGLYLGHASEYYNFPTHRILGILIFAFTTLQMLALRLKPKETDGYRKYWNIYHHFLGYALLTLVSVNIFKGLAILRPEHTWNWIYIGVLGVLASVTIALEIYTWFKFLSQKEKNKIKTADQSSSNQ